ncbi:MAG: hypothetical protein HY720_31020 [Planctomycetes bacterium]|nr:hypothetical protein [Planctomycetota bacterium]
MRTLHLALLAAALAGCAGPAVRRFREVEEPPPETRSLVSTLPLVARTDFRATEHRIEFEIEGIYLVEGVRRTTEKEGRREHDPWVEAGEMTLGALLVGPMVAAIPFHLVVIGPLMTALSGGGEQPPPPSDRRQGPREARAAPAAPSPAPGYDVTDYLTFIPEELLDPTENDLFPPDEEIKIVRTDEERYREERAELLAGEAAAGLVLAVRRVEALLEEGKVHELSPEDYRLDGWSLVVPEPRAGTLGYRLQVALQGQVFERSVTAE